MGKTLGAVLGTLYGPVSGYAVNGSKGFVQGIANATAALSGPVAYGAYVGGAVLGSLAKSPRSEQADNAIKMPIPPKTSGYGITRLHLAMELYR